MPLWYEERWSNRANQQQNQQPLNKEPTVFVQGETVSSVVLDILGIRDHFEDLMRIVDHFSSQINVQIHAHACTYSKTQLYIQFETHP